MRRRVLLGCLLAVGALLGAALPVRHALRLRLAIAIVSWWPDPARSTLVVVYGSARASPPETAAR